MSDTTTLIHEYEISRQLAERMNNASLTMKRSRRPGRNVTGLDDARKDVITVLARVHKMLLPEPESDPTNGDIPQDLIDDLRSRYGSEMPYLLRDMADAVHSLQAGGEIVPDAITVIDKLSQSADSVASASFRRLRRR